MPTNPLDDEGAEQAMAVMGAIGCALVGAFGGVVGSTVGVACRKPWLSAAAGIVAAAIAPMLFRVTLGDGTLGFPSAEMLMLSLGAMPAAAIASFVSSNARRLECAQRLFRQSGYRR